MFEQIVANGFIAAALYGLVAIGFAIPFSAARFFNFAHGAMFTCGPYCTLTLHAQLGYALEVALPLSIAFCGVLGGLIDCVVYRPLRKREASSLILLVASLGVYLLIQNTLSVSFGDQTQSLRAGVVAEGHDIMGARVTSIQIAIVAVFLAVILIAALVLRTGIGRTLRALSDNPHMARVVGIPNEQVTLWSFVVGSALAGLAGNLMALDVVMTPTMGMNALMMGIVASVVGGIGSVFGAAIGAVILGLSLHFGIWFLGGEWQHAIAFIILVVFLILRPQGIFGRA